MRRFILFFLGVIFFLPLCAEEEEFIPLIDTSIENTPTTEQPIERRSIIFEPTATREGNVAVRTGKITFLAQTI